MSRELPRTNLSATRVHIHNAGAGNGWGDADTAPVVGSARRGVFQESVGITSKQLGLPGGYPTAEAAIQAARNLTRGADKPAAAVIPLDGAFKVFELLDDRKGPRPHHFEDSLFTSHKFGTTWGDEGAVAFVDGDEVARRTDRNTTGIRRDTYSGSSDLNPLGIPFPYTWR